MTRCPWPKSTSRHDVRASGIRQTMICCDASESHRANLQSLRQQPIDSNRSIHSGHKQQRRPRDDGLASRPIGRSNSAINSLACRLESFLPTDANLHTTLGWRALNLTRRPASPTGGKLALYSRDLSTFHAPRWPTIDKRMSLNCADRAARSQRRQSANR